MDTEFVSRSGRKYYAKSSPLWSSTEELERSMSEFQFAPSERLPPLLMTAAEKQKRRSQTLVLEGEHAEQMALNAGRSPVAAEKAHGHEQEQAAVVAHGTEAALADDTADLTALQKQEIAARNAHQASRGRQIIEEDLSYNTVGVATWESLGLDPLMQELASTQYGPTATRVQSRLIPALLNEAHNDVIMNGVTGSGKTAALVLAAVQAIRNETAGMNIILCANSMQAKRCFDAVLSLAGPFGGTVVDRDPSDMSWVHCCEFFKDADRAYNTLMDSLTVQQREEDARILAEKSIMDAVEHHELHREIRQMGDAAGVPGRGEAGGPVRMLITTPDVMAHLLFEHKMEFQKFGYLRRCFVDDAGQQVDMVSPTAPVEEAEDRLRDPQAVEMVLGTLHQMPGPHIRSVMQIAAVSADIDTPLKEHLTSLCIKPSAKTVILSPTRLPTTLHCLFSFPTTKSDQAFKTYLVQVLRNAFPTIPGHCVIFVRKEESLLAVQRQFLKLGLDAKLLHDIYEGEENGGGAGGGKFRRDWRFLLLHEDDAPGLDIPFVSHVVITFCPSNRFSFLHMAGRTGRLGNVGWVYTIANRTEVKNIHALVGELDVDVLDNTIDKDLAQVPSSTVERWTKEPPLWGLDPQFQIERMWAKQENPANWNHEREFWNYPVERDFRNEDYTPIEVLERQYKNTQKLERDVMKDPKTIEVLQKNGFLDEYLRPTQRLRKTLKKAVPPGSSQGEGENSGAGKKFKGPKPFNFK